MPRKTQLDQAIDNLDREIATLQAARERLVKQRDAQAAKRSNTTGE